MYTMLRKQLLDGALKLRGRDVFSEYRKLKALEFRSLEENLTLQKERLKALLAHAYRQVPYYREVLGSAGAVSPNGRVSLERWKAVPPLTRDILNHHFSDLATADAAARKAYVNATGGSSGTPVRFMQDDAYWTGTMAAMWMCFSAAADFPCPHIKLWGSERDMTHGRNTPIQKLKHWLYQQRVLNAFRMSEQHMQDYVDIMNREKPVLLECYVQAIHELARFIRDRGMPVHQPAGIICSAGTLYPEMKTLIARVFGCPVINRYGSREAGTMAYSCPQDHGLHLNILQYYIEILRDDLSPCSPGEPGQVHVTTLTNYSMPLIRYRIGDMAVPAQSVQCTCGRGLPLIERVEGRETSMFETRAGEKISAIYFIHFFGVVLNRGMIRKFQVIQRDYDDIAINVVTADTDALESCKGELEQSIRDVMGPACRIEWRPVDDIPALANGKYLYTVNQMQHITDKP